MARNELFRTCRLNRDEHEALFNAFLSVCQWQTVYLAWHPNLPDEADNHLVESAVAGQASMIVTKNVSDFVRADLQFPGLRIVTPAALVTEGQNDGNVDHSPSR